MRRISAQQETSDVGSEAQDGALDGDLIVRHVVLDRGDPGKETRERHEEHDREDLLDHAVRWSTQVFVIECYT